MTAEGETHTRQRKGVSPVFAIGHIKDLVPIFEEKSDDLVNTLVERLSSQDSGKGIEMTGPLNRTTLDILGSAGLSNLRKILEANPGFGYNFNSLRNPDDPFAKSYAAMFNNEATDIHPGSAGNYISWFAKVAFPRVLGILTARKLIIKRAAELIRDK